MMGTDKSTKTYGLLKNWAQNESGATALEYALMAGLIAFAIIGGATALGNGLNENFNTSTDALEDAMAKAKG